MWFWRLLGLGDANRHERLATFWVAMMFFATLCSTFLLRPLRSQLGIDRGVAGMPWLYGMTVIGTVVLVLPFWMMANRLPSRRFVPISLHVGSAAMLLLAGQFLFATDFEWRDHQHLADAFWGGFSALNVALPALTWIHAVEHFGRQQGRRLFALIAVGGTLGTIVGSAGARLDVPTWVVFAMAGGMLQVAWIAYLCSRRHCVHLDGGETREHVSRGGVFEAVGIVMRDRRALQITCYMMLLGFTNTGFEALQTQLVGDQVHTASAQLKWFADLGFYGNVLVLALQLFCVGRLLSRASPVAFLVALPLLSIVGLVVYYGLSMSWLTSGALAIFCVQVARRGANYALEKPAREVLYTPLQLGTKHKVKFLVDTFAFRFGDWLGAVVQAVMHSAGLGAGAVVSITILFAVVWGALAWSLGRDQRPRTSPTASIS